MRQSILVIATITLASAALAAAEEWPKWLGPQGNNVSNQKGLAAKWPQGGPRKVWEKKVGMGYSSPVGFGGKVYLLTQRGRTDVLTAFNADTGEVAWSQGYEVTIEADQGQARDPDNGLPLPLATPTIEGDRIYTYGGGGDLVCRQLSDGKELWWLNVLKATKAQILAWNQSSSPLVTDKLVYVQGGRGGPVAVAVDKQTGKITWQGPRGNGGYAAPIIADVQGTRQLIVFGGETLFGLNPDNGQQIWSLPWNTSFQVNAATPIYHEGKLFISSDYGKGCAMLSLSPTGVSKDWENREIMMKYQPASFDNGYVYANSMGILKCMRWPDGKLMWRARDGDLKEGGTFVRAGDKLFAMSQDGNLSLIQATPESHQLINQEHLFDFGTTWASPLVYHGKLYALGRDNLVCLDISSPQTSG